LHYLEVLDANEDDDNFMVRDDLQL